MERKLILTRLLEKYENSKHLSQPNTSKRRVMLCINKNDLPEYTYENVDVRDRFNNAVRLLEKENIVEVKFLNDRPVILNIILNLQQIDKAYQMIHRIHPAQAAKEFCTLIENVFSTVNTPWIRAWKEDVCQAAKQTLRLPFFCKQGDVYIRDFFQLLAYYDRLNGTEITTRAFSANCLQNSKRFEKEFQDDFLRVAMRFHPEMAELSEQDEFSVREKLALLGIYSHPELYQLSGHFSITMQSGMIDFIPLFPYGIAIPDSAVDKIISFDLGTLRKIIFIENLTNYNEYLRSEIVSDELVIYHGGFLSPKKRQMLKKLSEFISTDTEIYFWADIDLGGFQMFKHLQKLFSKLSSIRMSAKDVTKYAPYGLTRDVTYLKRLQTALKLNEFPLFEDSIKMILQHGVTIEQELFLVTADRKF